MSTPDMPDFSTLVRQAWLSIASPRDVARWVMGFDMHRRARWELLLLTVILLVVVEVIQFQLMTDRIAAVFGEALAEAVGQMTRPFMAAITIGSLAVMSVFATFWIGRAMGGQGDLGDAVVLCAWFLFCLFLLECVKLVMSVALPPFGALLGIVGFGLFWWLMSNFVAELHGFSSLGMVFLMVLASAAAVLVGLIIFMSIIAALLGFEPPNVTPDV
ncbi:MAG: Yip1 family protein [Pseudomonadota bacterium]